MNRLKGQEKYLIFVCSILRHLNVVVLKNYDFIMPVKIEKMLLLPNYILLLNMCMDPLFIPFHLAIC